MVASASPTACASAHGPRWLPAGRSPTRERSLSCPPITYGRPTTPRSAWRGSVVIRCTSSSCAPTAFRGRSPCGSRTSSPAVGRGLRSRATCPSKAPQYCRTTSSTAPASRSPRSAMRACRRWSKQYPVVIAERRRAEGLVAAAQRILVIGIGGGGDVVGALAAAQAARALGTDAVVGGLTWERRPVDPVPGPRRLEEITGAQPLHEAVALAGADTV